MNINFELNATVDKVEYKSYGDNKQMLKIEASESIKGQDYPKRHFLISFKEDLKIEANKKYKIVGSVTVNNMIITPEGQKIYKPRKDGSGQYPAGTWAPNISYIVSDAYDIENKQKVIQAEVEMDDDDIPF